MAEQEELHNLLVSITGSVSALKAVSKSERDKQMVDGTARQFNQIRARIAELKPAMLSALPPEIEFGRSPAISGPRANYVDLLMYYEQIKHLLEYDQGPLRVSMS